MSFWIEYRIPEDTVRETYFVQRIEAAAMPNQTMLIHRLIHRAISLEKR